MFFKSKGKSVSFEAVRSALATVRDPGLGGHDLVALGAIKNFQIQDGHVRFTVQVGASGDQAEAIRRECEEAVRGVPGVVSVEVSVQPRPQSAPGPQAAAPRPRASAPGAGAQPGRISLPRIRHVIAVASGKGGVGKSTVTVNLAVALARSGAKVGLLDADLYGPSIPLMLGIRGRQPETRDERVVPIVKGGLQVMSMGLLVPEGKPVVWRGPMVHSALTQFLTQVEWGTLDYLVVDMPPGTGDAQLTISQTAPLSGAVIVTTPQEVSLIDARKGLQMFQGVSVPILGVVENMSGFVCEQCEHVTPVFRQGGGKRIAEEAGVPFLGSVPLDPRVAISGDSGDPILHSHPDSPAAGVFRELGERVRAQLPLGPEGDVPGFEPKSLEWQ